MKIWQIWPQIAWLCTKHPRAVWGLGGPRNPGLLYAWGYGLQHMGSAYGHPLFYKFSKVLDLLAYKMNENLANLAPDCMVMQETSKSCLGPRLPPEPLAYFTPRATAFSTWALPTAIHYFKICSSKPGLIPAYAT